MNKPPPKSSQDFYAAFSTVSSPEYPGNKPTAPAAAPAKAAPAAAAPPPAKAAPAKAAPAAAKPAPASAVQKPGPKAPSSNDFYAAFGTVSSPEYPGNKPGEAPAKAAEPVKPAAKAAEPAKPPPKAAEPASAVKKPVGKGGTGDFYAAFGTVSSPEYPGNKPGEAPAKTAEPAKPAKAEPAKPPPKAAEPAKAPPKAAEPAKPAAAPAGDKAARVCAGCEQPIKGTVVKALNQEWHKQCFVCSKCSGPFVGGTFAVKGGKPLCTNCSGK